MAVNLDLPSCDEPATVHIEVYSPRETLHGSLDASVYVCAQHASQARRAIESANLTAFQRQDAPPIGHAICGHIFDYASPAFGTHWRRDSAC